MEPTESTSHGSQQSLTEGPLPANCLITSRVIARQSLKGIASQVLPGSPSHCQQREPIIPNLIASAHCQGIFSE